jgi:hypothetical protein
MLINEHKPFAKLGLRILFAQTGWQDETEMLTLPIWTQEIPTWFAK